MTKLNWNIRALSDRFNTFKPADEIHPDAAVNIYVGWPTFFELIDKQSDFLGKNSLEILDFGSGAGGFIHELSKKGHFLTGADSSKEMINLAKKNLNNKVNIYQVKELFDSKKLRNRFDVVTAIHSLDWISNIKQTFKKLDKLLNKNGLIIFAVFPKEHVIESLEIKDLFEDFDSKKNPKRGFCNFDGIRTPVYIRDPIYFDKTFKALNYQKVLEYYPNYPKKFIERYNWKGANFPEMVIFAYRKN